ncbi:GNAT family N-acetyltransferase [Euzebya tangerina]|uniref:GNAT family N-acetyltransferase n=1 Tax=Euzebya tangerina TaxID=591198 RepID=UPI0013C2CFF2|nr:GNAT family N-acetyltransferase [Euzebya tangerina]
MNDVEVRQLAEADYPAAFQMRVDAFSAAGVVAWPEDGQPTYIPDERRLGAYADGELVGSCGVWPFGQWLGGRRVAMGGVGGVVIAPEARGRGVGSTLVRTMLHAEHEWGDALSCLYPTVPAFYRAHGYALAGLRLTRTIRTAALLQLPRPENPARLRPFDPERDLAAVIELLDARSRTHGRMQRDERRHRNMLEQDDEIRSWVAVEDGNIVGYLQWERREPDHGDRSLRKLVVDELAAVDQEVWLTLWRLVGSDGTEAQFTEYRTSPHDPLLDHVSMLEYDGTDQVQRWMARVIDIRAAVEQRGWPAGADVTVPLQIDDPILRHNSGAYHLIVSRGSAELAPARRSEGTATMDIGALSALFTGHVSARALADHGRLGGGSAEDITALDVAFAGPQPVMYDYF